MTRDQFELLQDKVSLWRRSSREGVMDLRDYNRRAEEALTAALVERALLLEAVEALMKDARPSNWDDDDDPEQVAAWQRADAAMKRANPDA